MWLLLQGITQENKKNNKKHTKGLILHVYFKGVYLGLKSFYRTVASKRGVGIFHYRGAEWGKIQLRSTFQWGIMEAVGNLICIIRVGWGSLALGYLYIPLVLFTVFVYLIFLLSHQMCYLIKPRLSSFLDVPNLQIQLYSCCLSHRSLFFVSVGA